MNTTSNYGLKKPSQQDSYNVDDFNDNMDIIDTKMKANADAASAAQEDIDDVFNKIFTVVSVIST